MDGNLDELRRSLAGAVIGPEDAGYGAQAFERLQALKRRYDPDNVLRRNQNIPPSGS